MKQRIICLILAFAATAALGGCGRRQSTDSGSVDAGGMTGVGGVEAYGDCEGRDIASEGDSLRAGISQAAPVPDMNASDVEADGQENKANPAEAVISGDPADKANGDSESGSNRTEDGSNGASGIVEGASNGASDSAGNAPAPPAQGASDAAGSAPQNPEPLKSALSRAGYSLSDLEQMGCGQLVVVDSYGSSADVAMYCRGAGGAWENAGLDTNGYVGSAGVSASSWEGSNETPYGLYRVGDGFYIDSAPETGLTLFHVTEDTYWVDDPDSVSYNRRVEGTANKDWDSAEHMIDSYSAYKYGFVIEFNTDAVIPGKGSAMFFHCYWKPTAGCVGVSEKMVLAYLRILDAGKNPYILIL